MKKTAVINLIVIIGLLVLSVMTLIAVYGTAPEPPTILLFEENFNVLDENKWKHESSKCSVEGDRFHYAKAEGDKGYVQNGILYMNSESTKEFYIRTKREAIKECQLCLNSESSNSDCFSSLQSTVVQTRNLFEARVGRIEVRAKLPSGDWMKSYIGILHNNADSQQELKSFNLIEAMSSNATNETLTLNLVLGPTFGRSYLESNVTRNDFHIYSVEWSENKVKLKIDGEEISERIFNFDNSTNVELAYNSTKLFSEPFHISLGVDAGDIDSKAKESTTKQQESSQYSSETIDRQPEDNTFQVDYIRLYQIAET